MDFILKHEFSETVSGREFGATFLNKCPYIDIENHWKTPRFSMNFRRSYVSYKKEN